MATSFISKKERPPTLIKPHKIWIEQCEAAYVIRWRLGSEPALSYLIGEKLLNFIEKAERHPEFAAELPHFQAEAEKLFNQHELAGYLKTLKPAARKKLQKLFVAVLD